MEKKSARLLMQATSDYLMRVGYLEQSAQQVAQWFIQTITGCSLSQLIVDDAVDWSDTHDAMLQKWLKQLVHEKKPLQYILGSVPFCGLDIIVEPPILIPRPETEEMVVWLIERLKQCRKKDIRILDMCCGSGCIALALAAALPDATIIGSDISEQAIALAEKNKEHNNVANVSFLLSNLFEQLEAEQRFDIIVANPPYLSQHAYENASDPIRLWEDKNALVARDEGMAIYEQIIAHAASYLTKGAQCEGIKAPSLVFEIGYEQAGIEKLLADVGFSSIKVHCDAGGLRRWVEAAV